eukprot:Skav230660  [mRNA]  locus=scaffold2185:54546:65681:+ [translate_table: standard]
MNFVQKLSQKSLAAQQRRANELEQRKAEEEANCQQWVEVSIKRFKEHCIEQSERGKNTAKMFLTENKWPKKKKDACFELLKQELQNLGLEKVEIKSTLTDKFRGSGPFAGLMLLDVDLRFVSEPAIQASWERLPNECAEQEPEALETLQFCRALAEHWQSIGRALAEQAMSSRALAKTVADYPARNGVEKWLSAEGGVEEYMVKTMRAEVKKGWETYAQESDRKEWVRKQYCQVMITVGSIYWTLETEEVLTATDGNKVQLMGKWFQKNKTQLEGLTELIRDKLNKLQRSGVVALVTQDVHNRDIIQDLFDNKITSMQNFKWQQQLRYYWDPKLDGDHGDCCIRQALHIKLGAAPAGPAGTGKTESTKALGVAMCLPCPALGGTCGSDQGSFNSPLQKFG